MRSHLDAAQDNSTRLLSLAPKTVTPAAFSLVFPFAWTKAPPSVHIAGSHQFSPLPALRLAPRLPAIASRGSADRLASPRFPGPAFRRQGSLLPFLPIHAAL